MTVEKKSFFYFFLFSHVKGYFSSTVGISTRCFQIFQLFSEVAVRFQNKTERHSEQR